MLKKITVIICTLAIIFTMNMTSFLFVKADTKTLDDVWSMLNSIDQALTAASSTRSGDLIYKFTQLKNDFEYIFGTSASGQGDGHINYVYNNQSVSGSTFNQAMGDMISQQNEILMSLVSSYVDASDPDNVIVQPGLFDRLTTIYNAVSSSATSDATIASYIDDITSETQQIRSILQNMNTYNIPIESLVAYNYFNQFEGASISVNSLTKYPMVNIKESVSNAYNAKRRVYIPKGHTLVIAFLLYSNDSIDQWHFIPYALNDEQQDNISVTYKFISISNTRRLYHVIVKNNYSAQVSVSFDFTYSSKSIIPFYVGLESLMSEDMQSAIMYYSRESNYQLLYDIRDAVYSSDDGLSWLQKIYNHLVGNPDPDNQYNSNKDNLNDSIDDYVAIESQFNTDFKNNMIDVKTEINNTGNMLQSLSMAASFVSNIIQKFYYNSNLYGFGILFLLPLILGIALFFIGRGGIVMRQGESVLEYQTVDDKPVYTPQGRKYQSHKIYRLRRKKG